MLIEFSVGNYKSFKEIVTFSMVAAQITAKDKTLDVNNIFPVDDELRLLKSAAVYGPNASGKSNFVAAIRFMRWFVLNSSKETQVMDAIEVEEFKLSTETIGTPTFFQMVFMLDGKRFRYGFEVDGERVVSEWLFHVPTIREAKLFVREEDRVDLSGQFKEGKGIPDKTRNNALFLSVVAQFNGAIAQQILRWFKDLTVISGLDDKEYLAYTRRRFESKPQQEEILRFVKKLDLGIHDIQIEKNRLSTPSLPLDMPVEFRNFLLRRSENDLSGVKTVHRIYDSEGRQASIELFDMEQHESEGTKKLFALAAFLLNALNSGHVLVVDELDARLHLLITCAIIDLFHSNDANPHHAQLIFTTHDTHLLSNKVFRRDQIWFVEKDLLGASLLHSLVEYKVRNDASFEKDYIHGRYGAIPFIGDLVKR